MPGLSLLCPCLNEEENLPRLIARVEPILLDFARNNRIPVEMILIDDGSTDATWTGIEAWRASSTFIRTVRHETRRGIAAAWSSGVSAATGEWVCVLDADLQYPPEDIPRLWAELQRTGADIVQGVRAAAGRRRDVRYVLSRGLNALLNTVFQMSLRDNKSGFFVCQRQLLKELLVMQGRYHHWQCFVMVAAHHGGHRIQELETPFHDRQAGQSAFGRVALAPALAVAADFLRATRDYGARRTPRADR